MEFVPLQQVNTTTGSAFQMIEVCSRQDELPNAGMGQQEKESMVDYKGYKYGYIKRYVNVAKWLRKRMLNWIPCDYNALKAPAYPTMGTLWHIRCPGYTATSVVG